jgi:pre-mRNA-splicing factor ATP-dependent RNA helicase DHX16
LQRAIGIRYHLDGILEKLEIRRTSSKDINVIKKYVLIGFFPHYAQLQENGTYKNLKPLHTEK